MADYIGVKTRLAAPIAIGVLAALATAFGSWNPSFWNDEAATLRLARLSLPQLASFVESKDAVHALYATMMHFWIQAFGESELSVRAPSIIAVGVATIGVYCLGLHLVNRRAALAAAVVFALLPRTAFNGIEARSYAIATALVVGAAILLLSAIRSRRILLWVVYLFLMTVAIYVFLYSALILPAFALAGLTQARPARADHLRRAVGALLPGVLAVPMGLIAVAQSEQVAWLRDQPINAYTIGVETFFGSAWWLAVLVVGLMVLAIVLGKLKPDSILLFLVVWLLAPLVLLVAVSVTVQPVFTPRYVSMSTPAMALLAGMAITSLGRRFAVLSLATFILAALPYFVALRAETSKPGGQDLRLVASSIQRLAVPGDGFLLEDTGTVSLRPRIALAAYPAAFSGLSDLALDKPYFSVGSYSDKLIGDATLQVRISDTHRIWLADRQGDSGEVDLLNAEAFHIVEKLEIGGVTVSLWEK
jgi:mannosyltransferase